MSPSRARFSRFALLVFILAVMTASAQQSLPPATQSPQRDPQAVAILQQSLRSLTAGGPAVQDAVIQGSIVLPDGTTGMITFKSKGNDLIRHELSWPTAQTTLVSQHGLGYVLSNGQKSSLPPWITAYLRPNHVPGMSRMADFVDSRTNLEYIGLEKVNGQPSHHIRITTISTDGTTPQHVEDLISEFHVYIDQQSLLPVKTLSFDFSPDVIENRTPVETSYDDYRTENGILLPHHITRTVAGSKDCDITLSSFRLNTGLSDTEFE